ncbi:PAS domain S-box protein [Niveibacterium sp. SC-1]|uniref:sensor histidine kinase n=1 Tax=Niveibacterium sp. SC-1 TaxID=3135646 RepID=UPI00311DBDC3
MDAVPVPVPLLVKDREERVLLANQAFIAFSRRTAESLMRERFVEPLGDLASRLAELDRVALATGEPQSLSDRAQLPDGSQGFMAVSRTACVGPEGVPALVCTYFDLTAEQEAETRQRLARDFLLRLLELLPNGVFVRDALGAVAMANPALYAMLGITADPAAEPDMGARLAAVLQESRGEDARVLAGATVWRDVVLTDGAGRTRSLRLLKAASRDAQGLPVVVGVLLDYTELIEAQAAERAASARVRAIYERAPMALAIVNTRGRFLQANASFCSLVGRSEAELQSMGFRDITPAGHAALDEAMMVKLVEEGRCGPFDKSYVHADGHVVPVRVTGVQVELGEGEEPVIWAMVDDISDELEAQKALRNAEQRWQFALAGSGDGVWDWDVRSSRVFFSPRWKRMFGHAEDEVGERLEEWSGRLHPEDQPAAMREVERHLVGETPNFSFEVRMRHKDGHWVWILSRGQAVERAADSSPLRVIGTHTDIGAIKQTQLELERSKAELEQHRDRLAELVHEQTADVIAARDAAEAANEAKDVFLANMSHELRTPLHAVLSFARLGEARTGKVDETRLRDYFARIAVGGERLLGLLNDLLDLAKLESGRMSIKPAAIDLAEVVREVLAEFEASFVAKRLHASLEMDPATPRAFADAVRIGQVLRNLLSNAIKFSPEGGAIALRLAPASLEGLENPVAAAELVVADEGLGIPAGELEHVFEKFSQSSKTDTGAGGTGLGLAICREIVVGHGGLIFARNHGEASDPGVDFVVRLPAVVVHAVEEPVQ